MKKHVFIALSFLFSVCCILLIGLSMRAVDPFGGAYWLCLIGALAFAALGVWALTRGLHYMFETEKREEPAPVSTPTRSDNGDPDKYATREWVEKAVDRKTSNCVRHQEAKENRDSYQGFVMFKGKRYPISIDKTKLYGHDTAGGGRVEHDRNLVKLTGEIWIGHTHIAQTRESELVCEVVGDIQSVLNASEHLRGELTLQIRTEVRRWINNEDVEKHGWPAAMVGFGTIFVGSFVKNFQMGERMQWTMNPENGWESGGYAINHIGGNYIPYFQGQLLARDCPSLDAAKAACERHKANP